MYSVDSMYELEYTHWRIGGWVFGGWGVQGVAAPQSILAVTTQL